MIRRFRRFALEMSRTPIAAIASPVALVAAGEDRGRMELRPFFERSG